MSLRSGHMELCDRTFFINITRSGDVETWNSYYYGDNNERTDLSGRIVEEGAQGIVFSFTGKEKIPNAADRRIRSSFYGDGKIKGGE